MKDAVAAIEAFDFDKALVCVDALMRNVAATANAPAIAD
jgi:hypothetical protein